MFILKILLECAFLLVVECCVQKTFESTGLTGIKDIVLHNEITDYNYFIKVHPLKLIPIVKITGCLTSTEEFKDAVAIQIRNERVPILYEGAVENLLSLHSLHIVSSHVAIIKPGAFENLPSLTVLKLHDNNIELIQSQVFNNLMVKKLILTFNRISYIVTNAFDNMPRLESVRLDNNRIITLIPNWFQNCPRLSVLSFKFNQITVLPDGVFQNIRGSLERLYLSNNNIREIHPLSLRGLKKLTDLSLRLNNISVIDNSTFVDLNNLKMIDLSETDITCLYDSLLNTLRSDVLLWIDNIPLNQACKEVLEEWTISNKNSLTFYRSFRNVTKGR